MSSLSSALLVLLLGIGIGAFFSIRLANRAALAGFEQFKVVIASDSDGTITAATGVIPDSALAEIRAALGARPVALVPVLELFVARANTETNEPGADRFEVVGLDLPALLNLPQRSGNTPAATKGAADYLNVLRDPLAVFVSPELARRAHLQSGSKLAVILNQKSVELHVAGPLPQPRGQPSPPPDLLLMDLPALQQLSGNTGQLSRIEIVVEANSRRAALWVETRQCIMTLAARKFPAWTVAASVDRRQAAATMTRAFRLNLTILSLLALFVGLYLVFQGFDGAVIRRRQEIAILRSLGISSHQLQLAWLVEAAVMGLAGGLLGLLLGWAGAQGAVRLIGRTVDVLYYSNSVNSAGFDFGEAGIALSLAIVSSIIAAWYPSLQAARTPPVQIAIRPHHSSAVRIRSGMRATMAFLLIGFGILCSMLPPLRLSAGGRFSLGSYCAGLTWLLGIGLLGGFVLRGLGVGLRHVHFRSATLRLAASHLALDTSRHRLAAASLICAVAMTAGMAILVGSFDRTMRGWIARTFQADLYVSGNGSPEGSTANRIQAVSWQAILRHPAVRDGNVLQTAEIELNHASTVLIGERLSFFRDHAHPAWISAPRDDAVFTSASGYEVLVSEAFSERFRVGRDAQITIPTPSGPRIARIAGVFSDYGNERGSVLVDRGAFAQWFGTDAAASVIVALKPGNNVDTVAAELRRAYPGYAVFTNGNLRDQALRIFRQTFAVTYALETIGVVVAIVGLTFTMISLLWERRFDLATLRSLGMHRVELAAAAGAEGFLTSLTGVLMGIAASFPLGWLLIHRINKQTFGWTLQTHWALNEMLLLAVLVVGSAVATSWTIGRWASGLPAEREE